MSIPGDPTVAQIVTEGLKRGGRVNPTATEISDATTNQFREVKADFLLAGGRVDVLLTQAISTVIIGVSRYAWPVDAYDIRSIQLIDAPTQDSWTGTLQAGTSTTATIAGTFNQANGDVQGRFIFLTGGTGSGQFRQIKTYDNGTKIATVDTAWTTTPDSSTTYLIETFRRKLFDIDKPTEWDVVPMPFGRGMPVKATIVGREIWLDYTPDRQYVLLVDYWTQLDRIDEAGVMFTRHLREYRSLWTQGVAVKTMQRFDEDRYALESQVYSGMFNAYQSQEADIGQVIFRSV